MFENLKKTENKSGLNIGKCLIFKGKNGYFNEYFKYFTNYNI